MMPPRNQKRPRRSPSASYRATTHCHLYHYFEANNNAMVVREIIYETATAAQNKTTTRENFELMDMVSQINNGHEDF
jgi:hypothetical protein